MRYATKIEPEVANIKHIGRSDGLEPATSCVTDRGAVVIVTNSDRCEVLGTYRVGMVLAARA